MAAAAWYRTLAHDSRVLVWSKYLLSLGQRPGLGERPGLDPGGAPNSMLPSEAQWEYAARGTLQRAFPWGDLPPSEQRMRYAQHRSSATDRADTLPLADVNDQLGMSPFGLHHMAGNIWQWCRDWYDQEFYSRPEATRPDPLNRRATGIRSERGGSWIGPADLCRSSFRRGRPPAARGHCLGFRCVSSGRINT